MLSPTVKVHAAPKSIRSRKKKKNSEQQRSGPKNKQHRSRHRAVRAAFLRERKKKREKVSSFSCPKFRGFPLSFFPSHDLHIPTSVAQKEDDTHFRPASIPHPTSWIVDSACILLQQHQHQSTAASAAAAASERSLHRALQRPFTALTNFLF